MLIATLVPLDVMLMLALKEVEGDTLIVILGVGVMKND